MHFDWLKGLISRNSTRGATHASRKRKPPRQQLVAASSAVEPLEERVVPAVYNVLTTGDSDLTVVPNGVDFNATTLRGAIEAANETTEADTIYLPEGTITLSGSQLFIEYYSIEIIGAGLNESIIDADHESRIFAIGGEGPQDTSVALRQLTLKNGSATGYGGAIVVNESTLTLEQVLIEGSTANLGLGGAISASSTDLIVESSTITNNQAIASPGLMAAGGGIATRLGTLNIQSSTISNNQAIGSAGPAGVAGAQGVTGATGTSGMSTIPGGMGGAGGAGGPGGAGGQGGLAQGGGIYSEDTDTTINNSTIASNTATGGAGGAGGDGGQGGAGGFGGVGGTESSGGAGGAGGVGGPGGNGGSGGAAYGGGISSNGPTIIINSAIASNTATSGAGGVGGAGGTGGTGGFGGNGGVTSGNGGDGGAGGIAGPGGFGGSGGTAKGGGIYVEGNTSFINSTIANNTLLGGFGGLEGNGGVGGAGGLGGASSEAAQGDPGSPGLAGPDGFEGSGGQAYGGGISVGSHPSVTISNSTVAYNAVYGGSGGIEGPAGGGGVFGTGVTLFSSIIASNNVGGANSDLMGTYSSSGYNLIENQGGSGTTIGGPGISYDLYDTSPGFDPSGLQNNGGPTQTIALAGDSPAIDHGAALLLPYDQRGEPFTRSYGPHPDIGAFEFPVNANNAPYVENPIPSQTATEDQPFSFTISSDTFGDDDVGDSLTYSVVGMPDWMFFNPHLRTFIGTPGNADVTLHPIYVTVIVTDDLGATASTEFSLTVENTNDAPTVEHELTDQTATEDAPFSYIVPEHTFGDVDEGDSLTYTTSDLPAWLSFNPETREFTGTPLNQDVTIDPVSITVTATDESDASVSSTFELTVLNTEDPPYVENSFSEQTAEEDVPFTFEIPDNIFQDPDVGDSLTYSATNLPAWLTFDPETQTFSGTPSQSDVTTDPIEITVTVEDESHETVSAILLLSVVNTNDAPQLVTPLVNQTATEDAPFSYIVPLDTFMDADLVDTLTFSAPDLPAWLSFDPETQTFSGTPTNDDVTIGEPITITVVVTDLALATASATFTLTVLNTNDDPTVLNPISPQTATEDQLFEFVIPSDTFEDVDHGDTLVYSVTGLPAWLNFDPETRQFSGTPGNSDVTQPNAELVITVTVTDGSEAETSTTFDLSVVNQNDAPTVVHTLENQSATEDSPFNFTLPGDTFDDIDAGDSLTYSATGLPSWLAFDPETGVFSGTPLNADVTVSPITVTVTATDEHDASVSTTFELTVTNTNDAPTIPGLPGQVAVQGAFFTYAFAEDSFTDVDVGDSLTYTAEDLPGWLSFDPQTRTFSGTPTNADVTPTAIRIAVIATDTSGASVEMGFSLFVINLNDDPTVANVISPQTAIEDALFTFTLPSDTFNDIDVGQVLTYSATGLPSWLSFDPQTGIFSGTPDDADTGSSPSTITVTADDAQGGTVSTTFQLSVTPVNDHTPVFTTGTQTVTLLEQSANSTIVATVAATDADLPPESLTYSITAGNTNGAFTINPTTGVITVLDSNALDFETNPSFTLTVQVTDNGTPTVKTATATVTVNLTQLPGPTITLNPNEGLFFINDSRALVDPSATFTNQRTPETFAGAQLKVSIASGRVRRDGLTILAGNKISTRGNRVSFKGEEIGTFTGGTDRNPDLVITFNSSASTAAINALVKQINFSAARGIGETRAVTMQVLNLSGTESPIATRNIRVERLARSR